ncbi:MAG: hypothetical protein ABI577_00270 [bacterium]
MRRILLVALCACAVLAFACSSSDGDDGSGTTSDSTATPNPNDTEIARSMLLTISDFPTGWAESTSADENSPLDKCQTETDTPNRASADFAKGSGNTSISQTAAVFPLAEDAQKSIDGYRSRLDCAVKLINDGKLDNKDTSYVDAKVGALSFPALGEQSTALRLTMTAKPKNTTGSIAIFFDVVLVRKGRTAFSLLATDVLSPFNSNDLEAFVRKAAQKLP